jgi:ribose transport system permease protein
MSAAPQMAGPPSAVASAGDRLRRLVTERPIIVLLVLLLLLIAATEISPDGDVNTGWARANVQAAAILAILAAGQTLVMLTGGIDLSVANVMTAAAYVTAANGSGGEARAVALGLAVGVLVGVINGVGVAVFRVQPLIMTLGMGAVIVGVLTVYSQQGVSGTPLVPKSVRDLGSGSFLDGTVPYNLLLWAPLAGLILYGLRGSGFGRMLYAVGDNEQACRLAGIRVWQVQLAVYIVCSLLSAVAGLLLLGYTNAADLELGNNYLLPSVAAVVIGGTSIFGGVGGYGGTIVGALILTVLGSLLTLLDVEEAIRQVLYGTIILVLAWAYTRVSGGSSDR